MLKALIDTGAQINVVRRGLFSENDMRPAKHPLRLTLADGQPFWGGDREIQTRVTFGKTIKNIVVPWRARADFYEGDIKADLILSLPWLAKNGLDVLTKEGCLGQRDGWKVYPIGDCPEIDPIPDGDWIDTDVSSRSGCQPPRPKPRPSPKSPPLQAPCINRVEAKRRRRRTHKQTRRRRLEEEADGLLVACVQAHDSPPSPGVCHASLVVMHRNSVMLTDLMFPKTLSAMKNRPQSVPDCT